jgi:hypothetical protein
VRHVGELTARSASDHSSARLDRFADEVERSLGDAATVERDWASGANSYGVAAVNAGPTPTRWRVRTT